MGPKAHELRSGWLALVAICSLVLGGLAGITTYRSVLLPSDVPDAATFGEASIGGPFSLIDQNGRRVTDLDFRNRPMVITFGYTIDPDQTPAALQAMNRIIGSLGAQAEKAVFAFITLDARDTPERLAAYLQRFNSRILGLTGSEADIAAVAKNYRLPILRVPGATPEDSQSITFDPLIFLLNSQGIYILHVNLGDDLMPVIHRLKQVF